MGSDQKPPSGGKETMGCGGEVRRMSSSLCLEGGQGAAPPGIRQRWSSSRADCNLGSLVRQGRRRTAPGEQVEEPLVREVGGGEGGPGGAQHGGGRAASFRGRHLGREQVYCTARFFTAHTRYGMTLYCTGLQVLHRPPGTALHCTAQFTVGRPHPMTPVCAVRQAGGDCGAPGCPHTAGHTILYCQVTGVQCAVCRV